MLQSLRPTSLIDLGNLSVRRMYAFNEYSIVQREYRSWEIDKLLQKAPTNAIFELGQYVFCQSAGLHRLVLASRSQKVAADASDNGPNDCCFVSSGTESIFCVLSNIQCRTVAVDTSYLPRDLPVALSAAAAAASISTHQIRRGRTVCVLPQSCMLLVFFFPSDGSFCSAKSRKKTPNAPPRFLEAASKAQMRFDLDLQHEDDYLLLLHLADTMQPGIYTEVENPDIFLHNVLEFFDNFAS
jgi:hypothetical protein